MIREQIKRVNRKEALSPLSIVITLWIVLVVLLPYVLGWSGMSGTFWASIEFQGIV